MSIGVVQSADNAARARIEVSWHSVLFRGDTVLAVNGVTLANLSAAQLSSTLAEEWRAAESEGVKVSLRLRRSSSTPQHAQHAPTEEGRRSPPPSPAQPTGEDPERPWRLGRPSRGATPDSRGPQGREEEAVRAGGGGSASRRSPRELLAEGLEALDREAGSAQGSPRPLTRQPSVLSLAHTPFTAAARTPAASPRADRHRAEEEGLRRLAEALREREAEVARREAAVAAAAAALPAQEGDEDALLRAMLRRAAGGRPSTASSAFEVEVEARRAGAAPASPPIHLPAVEQATPLHAFLASRSFATLPPTLPAGPPAQERSAAPPGRSTRIDVPDGEPWEWAVQATPRSPPQVVRSPLGGRRAVAPVSPVQAATTAEEERLSFLVSSRSAAAVFVREAASPAPRQAASTAGALPAWPRPSPAALAPPPRRVSVGSSAWERGGGGWGGTSPQPALPLLASPAPQARPSRPGRRGSGEGGGGRT